MQEVCLNLAMPLGIGAGVLVLAIGILSILFFKCYIVVISSYLLTVQYISASSSIVLHRGTVKPSYLLTYR